MNPDLFLVDLSHPLDASTPPFPGNAAVRIEIVDAIPPRTGDGRKHCNASRLDTSLHCGTHMDAPFHFVAEGTTIDAVSLARCLGPAVRVRHPTWGPRADIEVAHLTGYRSSLDAAPRIIFDTGWSRRWGKADYFTDHPVLTGDTARWLVDQGVVLVGVDFPSVDRPPHPAHDVLLGNGLVIVENLTRLDAIPTDTFEFCALPLAITGRDGSPVRAVARPLPSAMSSRA